jgi:signal transduction histidine kinase
MTRIGRLSTAHREHSMQSRPQDCTILLVDDEEANLDLLEAILRDGGYSALLRTSRSQEVLTLFRTARPDLVLLDLHMPPPDGFEVLAQLRDATPADAYLPVLVLTADAAAAARERALSGGARDFLTKPFDIVEVLLRVKNLLEARLLHRLQLEARERAEALAAENGRLFAEARDATQARERLLSVVAHDLRNPLSVVAMHAEMLQELGAARRNPYQREALRAMREATERMQLLVDDLLDLARLENGTFSLRPQATAADELMGRAERSLRPVAEAQGIVLEVGCEGGVGIDGDADRLLQVLTNLVANALKFSPPGGRVRVLARRIEGMLRVSVADEGSGIPPEHLPHLFTAFWQAQNAQRAGVGLGLWIARAIVEAHGGRIWVESVVQVGSTFHFEVPISGVIGWIAETEVDAPIARPAGAH